MDTAGSSTETTAIDSWLEDRGFKPRAEWLNSCISELNDSVPGFRNLDVAEKGKLIQREFLSSDMNVSGGGVLPENVHALLQDDLPGQVDEIVDVSCDRQCLLHIRQMDPSWNESRCLKLSMTDGVQRVTGLEFRPMNGLQSVAGLKVFIRFVHVRLGVLTLVPELLFVYEDLEPERNKLAIGVGDGAIADNSTSQDAIPSSSSFQGTLYAPSSINRASNVECITASRVAGGFNETNIADAATVGMSDLEFAVSSDPFYYFVPDVGRIAVDNSQRNKEIPWTYLANLLSYWAVIKDDAPFIQSYIKCAIVGMWQFAFKDRTEFELVVRVDDGSLQSQVCIHHNVVESLMGYSLVAVNAALSSPHKDVRDEMLETIEAFKNMLLYFRGTLLVDMRNRNSATIPVALEMNYEDGTTFDMEWFMTGLYGKNPPRLTWSFRSLHEVV
ncbi:hypothetical protein MKW94_012053 [Papaver nudicaule]|uniref:RecQ-mediated genome instability protein 1 n=1 Tax=Papaver nudicaule TaxID=74823 RepID=A0AA41SJA6_PAPNU|nr:hypothetical protein [Papaver nudicaule]